jgi:hypothetical protein
MVTMKVIISVTPADTPHNTTRLLEKKLLTPHIGHDLCWSNVPHDPTMFELTVTYIEITKGQNLVVL